MPSLSAEARKTARRAARSSGVPAARLLLDSTLVERARRRAPGPASSTSSSSRVFSAPGAIALTSIPVPAATSAASVSANRTTAAFDAAYALRRGSGDVAPPPESWMILPYPFARKCGSTARQQRTEPKRFTRTACSHSSQLDVLDQPFRPVDARVVHEHVDAREALERHEPPGAATSVGLETSASAVATEAGSEATDSSSRPGAVEGLLVARADEHARPGCDERCARSRARGRGSPPVTIAVLPVEYAASPPDSRP